jgi:hypothetical protein
MSLAARCFGPQYHLIFKTVEDQRDFCDRLYAVAISTRHGDSVSEAWETEPERDIGTPHTANGHGFIGTGSSLQSLFRSLDEADGGSMGAARSGVHSSSRRGSVADLGPGGGSIADEMRMMRRAIAALSSQVTGVNKAVRRTSISMMPTHHASDSDW